MMDRARKMPKILLMPSLVANLSYSGYEKLPIPPAPPSYMKLVEHFTHEKEANQNPGFYAKNGVNRSPDLQGCLDKRMASFKKIHGNNIALALVDLTDDKMLAPDFAGYNSTLAMYGASQSKMGALLAAHQMRYDVEQLGQKLANVEKMVNADAEGANQVASDQSSTITSAMVAASSLSIEELIKVAKKSFGTGNLNFKLRDKFDFSGEGEHIKVAISKQFAKEIDQMMRISNNYSATVVIKKLGFNYINSVLWQTGIYDIKRGGGLWVGRSYAGGKYWHRDPVANLSHGTNPVSLAKYLTLMGQRRLVSEQDSKSIEVFLSNTRFRIKFVKGLMGFGLKVNNYAKGIKDDTKKATVFRKSGTMNGSHRYSHDATFVERYVCLDTKKSSMCQKKKQIRYVAVGASQLKATYDMWRLGQAMDRCIRDNNGIST